MSKIRAAALGAVVFVGMAVSAGAQAPTTADSARMKDGPRRERVEGMKKRGMERGMRKAGMHRGMRGEMRRGMRGGPRGFGAQLNLTEDQRNRVTAIHAKYRPQFKALREQDQAQFRQRASAIRQQQQNEIRAILTPEQRAKADSARTAQAARLEERARQLQEQARQLRAR